jgi:uncharacterized membrane protein YcaP (DUF421 family)
MDAIFRIDPSALLRLFVVGALTYVALVATLRVAGKRTLAKMNAFDLVVTVSLGSALSSALVSQSVTLVQALSAIALLVLLQVGVAFGSVHSGWVRRVTRSSPAVLYRHDRYERASMRRERVTESEIRQAIRSSGLGRLDAVGAVVLETDGTFSAVRAGDTGELTDPETREPSAGGENP